MSYVMTGKPEGVKGRPTSLCIIVDEGAFLTFAPKFNICNYKNFQLNFQGMPSELPPALKKGLEQVQACVAHKGEARSLPNLRFTIDTYEDNVAHIFKLNEMMGFVYDTNTGTHLSHDTYSYRMVQDGLIGAIPFTACSVMARNNNIWHTSYYPSHQKDAQMDLDPMAYFDPKCKCDSYVATPMMWNTSKFVPSNSSA